MTDNWGAARRLDYIDFRMVTTKGVRRSDIMLTFGVSMPAASASLNQFLALYPDSIVYDKTAKRYVPAKGYKTLRGNTPGVLKAVAKLRSLKSPLGWK